MLLQAGGEGVRFKPRPVEGVDEITPEKLEHLILDGQQRLTSLYQALRLGRAVRTRDARGAAIQRWYYVDMGKALAENGDREEAIIGIPDDKKVRNFRGEVKADYSTRELECRAGLFPLPLVFDVPGLTAWMMDYLQVHGDRSDERLNRWNRFLQSIIQRFQQYQVPLIVLRKETPKEAVCQVFEKVNTGGVSLTVFELLTATFAADDFQLREDWEARQARFRRNPALRQILGSIENTDFLQAISLLVTRARRQAAVEAGVAPEAAPGISCKRKDILRLTLEEYQAWAGRVTEGFEKAGRFLFQQKIFVARDVPYRTQVTPLAAILTVLGDRSDQDGIRSKLARWYWCGVFGELYGGAIESRFAKDLPEVLAWADGGPEPDTVSDANFAPARLLTLRTRNSAAYKGLHAVLMRNGGLDFRSGTPIDVQQYFEDRIDIHHVFPQHWCRQNGIDARRCDSVINKTPLSARTNRLIGGRGPSKYLLTLQREADISHARMDEILSSHLIDPGVLRADDFDGFFAGRERALLARIEEAMGKPLVALPVESEPDVEPAGSEEDDDWGAGAAAEPGGEPGAQLERFDEVLRAFEAVRDQSAPAEGFVQLLADFGKIDRS